jgi:hypothetical protein
MLGEFRLAWVFVSLTFAVRRPDSFSLILSLARFSEVFQFKNHGPFLFGDPDEYAQGKAREFPDEGGPVILVLQVPYVIVQKAATDWFPLRQGLVQFDPGSGLEELAAVWSQIASSAMIRSLT